MAQPSYEWHPPEGRWTEQDLSTLPADGHRYEVIDGSLLVTPPAEDDHHELADDIRGALRIAAPPGWRVIREIGLRVPGGNVIPDVTVLRPGAPRGVRWHEAGAAALVVEVESPSSRRHDRFTKLALYAEAGVESYWRIERGEHGPVAHLYTVAAVGRYELRHSVHPGEVRKVELPFSVQVDPAAWQAGIARA